MVEGSLAVTPNLKAPLHSSLVPKVTETLNQQRGCRVNSIFTKPHTSRDRRQLPWIDRKWFMTEGDGVAERGNANSTTSAKLQNNVGSMYGVKFHFDIRKIIGKAVITSLY